MKLRQANSTQPPVVITVLTPIALSYSGWDQVDQTLSAPKYQLRGILPTACNDPTKYRVQLLLKILLARAEL